MPGLSAQGHSPPLGSCPAACRSLPAWHWAELWASACLSLPASCPGAELWFYKRKENSERRGCDALCHQSGDNNKEYWYRGHFLLIFLSAILMRKLSAPSGGVWVTSSQVGVLICPRAGWLCRGIWIGWIEGPSEKAHVPAEGRFAEHSLHSTGTEALLCLAGRLPVCPTICPTLTDNSLISPQCQSLILEQVPKAQSESIS